MEYILSEKNKLILQEYADNNTLFAFDFDGTLAPITDFADQACLSEEIALAMNKLSLIAPVAIITGRSIADLKSKISFKPAFIVGNHGVENEDTELTVKEPSRDIENWLLYIQENYSDRFDELGIELENKMYSLSLHFRRSPKKIDAEMICMEIASRLNNAKIIQGKMVVNIVPSTSENKGDSFLRLLSRGNFQRGFYVGDDVTDEDVFKLGLKNVLTVKIESLESSKANFYLKHQSEIIKLLEIILKKLPKR